MATVNRRICGIRNNESVLGTSMPDARLEDNKYLNDCVFDFRQKLRALPAFLQDLNATYTRNSEKRVVQDGALVTLAANQFGTSYDDVTGLYGYVPEPAATNLATNSDGSASTYNVSNVADGTAVPGFTNGLAFGDNSVQRAAAKPISVTAGTAYSVSFFVSMDDGGAPVVGATNTTGDFSITTNSVIHTDTLAVRAIGGGVYRVSASRAPGSTTTALMGITKFTGQSARTFRITGAQVETGARATSYIATTGSTASRAADVLSVPLANIPGFSAAGYTLFADVRMDYVATGVVVRAITVSDGDSSDRSVVGFAGTTQKIGLLTVSGGVAQHSVEFSTWNTIRRKIGYSVAANSYLTAIDGAAQTPDTSGIMPVGLSRLDIGSAYGTEGHLNGFIFRAGLVPQALTQAQINGMTA